MKLKEEIIEINFSSKFTLLLKHYFKNVDVLKYAYADVDYIESENNIAIIRAALSTKSFNTPKKSNRLQSVLQKLKSISFNDVLFITTLLPYHESDIMNSLPEKAYQSRTYSLIDEILKDTNGYLAYHYQLEQLIAMANNCSIHEAVNIRKAIGKKEKYTLEILDKMKIEDKFITHIMEERMFNPFTLYPNYRGAYVLYNYMNYSNKEYGRF